MMLCVYKFNKADFIIISSICRGKRDSRSKNFGHYKSAAAYKY